MKPPGDVALIGPAVRRAEPRGRLLVAVLVAVGVHGSLWYWARHCERADRSSSARVPRVDAALSRPPPVDLDIDTDMADAPRRPPPPPSFETPRARLGPREKPSKPAPPTRLPATGGARADSPTPAAPAAAGGLIAGGPDPSAPVDLTSDTFVTGTARSYTGGGTTTGGGNPVGVPARAVGPRAADDPGAAPPDRSSRVSLDDQSWSCPWPREADAEQIDEQTVVIRVVVGPDGGADSVDIVSVSTADPGHGFARAAATCALHTRFTPARDRSGDPVRARSPPIRVRFTR